MGTPPNFQHFILLLLALAFVVVFVWVTIGAAPRRGERYRRNADLLGFSNLDLFSKELAESSDPQEMNERALRGTLEMLEVSEGYLLLCANGPGAARYVGVRGFSEATVRRLESEKLRPYLAASVDRWGNLVIFPDLRRSQVLAAWQRDPLFPEFRALLDQEGLRTLIIVGLASHGKSHGALLLGTRKVRTFQPQELRIALALGNRVSAAMEKWSLNRAAEYVPSCSAKSTL